MDKEIVLITGTNSGFGYLATIELASKGYFVIATMRDVSKKQDLLKEAKQRKLTELIEVFPLDVTNEQQIEDVKQHMKERYGRIDILINNAGYSVGGMTELLEVEEWKKQFETNLFGVIAVTKAFLPMMREKRKGKIINIGSISGRVGFPGLGPYVSSKFALAGYSESLRLELLPFNISVSLLEPGSYKTDIWEKALGKMNLATVSEYDIYMKKIYAEAKRSGEQAADPNEVVQVILNICKSNKPKFRYPIGKGIRSIIFIKNILPWSFIESLVQRKMST
ncbi:SDR family oxidoreductase [Alkalihalobacillus sp. BA299]|uniref:SDR family oxidoreductase n=1 Tax=Alkalihalobacillus sp. BA299 TaxID=2815938 RepID=UPI001ADB9EAD|nr:SDR family oxidoreductase [Alkalihalobacillus sp. BA299]